MFSIHLHVLTKVYLNQCFPPCTLKRLLLPHGVIQMSLLSQWYTRMAQDKTLGYVFSTVNHISSHGESIGILFPPTAKWELVNLKSTKILKKHTGRTQARLLLLCTLRSYTLRRGYFRYVLCVPELALAQTTRAVWTDALCGAWRGRLLHSWTAPQEYRSVCTRAHYSAQVRAKSENM